MSEQLFSVKAPHDDNSWAVGRGMLRLSEHRTSSGVWWAGDFITPHGLVTIQREATFTRLDFAHAGRCYSRVWHEYFGDRTINRLARSFAHEITQGDPS